MKIIWNIIKISTYLIKQIVFYKLRKKIKPYEDKKYQEYYYLLNK